MILAWASPFNINALPVSCNVSETVSKIIQNGLQTTILNYIYAKIALCCLCVTLEFYFILPR